MNSDEDRGTRGSQGSSRFIPPGAQGASRGGVRPDDSTDNREHESFDPNATYARGRGAGGQSEPPFGGYPFGGSQGARGRGGGRWSHLGETKFLGLPVGLIYGLGAALISIVLIGTLFGAPTATGSVAGQVKQMGADQAVSTLPGAQLTLRGNGQTLNATSTDVPADAEGEAAYNYRFENVPPGTYALTVQPPAGAALQPEENITLNVESKQLFPQSVMLLADGIQKPRQLAENELQSGEAGGYIDGKGERHTYQQNGGFDTSDALLMYLLWRNPSGWGYGAPPVIVNSPGGSSSYRVAEPPAQTRSGQTVTQQRPSTPGQGSVRPSSGSGATGSAPSRTSGGGGNDAVVPSTGSGASSSGTNSGANTSTQPSTSTGAGSSTITRPNVPSQGTTRPSSSSSSPSRSSAPSRSSGGGRR